LAIVGETSTGAPNEPPAGLNAARTRQGQLHVPAEASLTFIHATTVSPAASMATCRVNGYAISAGAETVTGLAQVKPNACVAPASAPTVATARTAILRAAPTVASSCSVIGRPEHFRRPAASHRGRDHDFLSLSEHWTAHARAVLARRSLACGSHG